MFNEYCPYKLGSARDYWLWKDILILKSWKKEVREKEAAYKRWLSDYALEGQKHYEKRIEEELKAATGSVDNL